MKYHTTLRNLLLAATVFFGCMSKVIATEETIVLEPFEVNYVANGYGLPTVDYTYDLDTNTYTYTFTDPEQADAAGAGQTSAGSTSPSGNGKGNIQTVKKQNTNINGKKGIVYTINLPPGKTGLYVQVIMITRTYANGQKTVALFTEAARVVNGKFLGSQAGQTTDSFLEDKNAVPTVGSSGGYLLTGTSVWIVSSFIEGSSTQPDGMYSTTTSDNGVEVNPGDLYIKTGSDISMIYDGNPDTLTYRGFTVTSDDDPSAEFLGSEWHE